MSIQDENGNREGRRQEGRAARRASRPINKKRRPPKRPPCRSTDFAHVLAAGDLAGLQAAGADVGLLLVAVDDDGDTLNVGLERTGDGAVGVADGTTSNRVLTAELTNLRHD